MGLGRDETLKGERKTSGRVAHANGVQAADRCHELYWIVSSAAGLLGPGSLKGSALICDWRMCMFGGCGLGKASS